MHVESTWEEVEKEEPPDAVVSLWCARLMETRPHRGVVSHSEGREFGTHGWWRMPGAGVVGLGCFQSQAGHLCTVKKEERRP